MGWAVAETRQGTRRAALVDSAAVARATIPVERARAAFLLVTSRDDGAWPATTLTQSPSHRVTDNHRATLSAALRSTSIAGIPVKQFRTHSIRLRCTESAGSASRYRQSFQSRVTATSPLRRR